MSRRDPASFRKNINRVVGAGCLVTLVIGLGLGYMAMQKQVARVRENPLKVLEVMARAQKNFIYSDADKDGKKQPAESLEQLAQVALIPKDWGGGTIASYRYRLIPDERSAWAITADPIAEEVARGEEPREHYRRDGFDVVTAARGRPATREDRVVSSPRRR